MTFVFSRNGFVIHPNFTNFFTPAHPSYTEISPESRPGLSEFHSIFTRNSSEIHRKNQKRRITELEARNAFISNRLETYDSQIAGEQTRVQEIIDMVSVETTLNC